MRRGEVGVGAPRAWGGEAPGSRPPTHPAEGVLTLRARPPSEAEFVDCFQKTKLAINLLVSATLPCAGGEGGGHVRPHLATAHSPPRPGEAAEAHPEPERRRAGALPLRTAGAGAWAGPGGRGAGPGVARRAGRPGVAPGRRAPARMDGRGPRGGAGGRARSDPRCAPDRQHLRRAGPRALRVQPPALPRRRGLPARPPGPQGDVTVGVAGGDLDAAPVRRRWGRWGSRKGQFRGPRLTGTVRQLRVAPGTAGAPLPAQIPQRLGTALGRAAGGALGGGGAGVGAGTPGQSPPDPSSRTVAWAFGSGS